MERKMPTQAITVRGREDVPAELRPVPIGQGKALPNDSEYAMMLRIASLAVDGANAAGDNYRAIPANIKTPEQAMTLMLAGMEKGFPPFAALQQLYIVNGRIEGMTQSLIALVLAGDPSARFVFHRYDSSGAAVELIRDGSEPIRVSYTEEDRNRARQGMKPKRDWEHPRTARNGDKYFPIVKVNGITQYEPDEDSYWNKWPRDAYAYNAIKRCIRLGAADLLLLGPRQAPPLKITTEPTAAELAASPEPGSLAFALASGEVTPLDVFSDEIERPSNVDEDGVIHDEAAESSMAAEVDQGAAPPPSVVGTDAESNETVRIDSTGLAGASTEDEDPDGPVDAELAERITVLMVRTKSEFSADYNRFYRELAQKYFGDPRRFDPIKLTLAKARACLSEIRSFRGEIAPEEVEAYMSEVTRDPAEPKPDDEEEEPEEGDKPEEEEPTPENPTEPSGNN